MIAQTVAGPGKIFSAVMVAVVVVVVVAAAGAVNNKSHDEYGNKSTYSN